MKHLCYDDEVTEWILLLYSEYVALCFVLTLDPISDACLVEEMPSLLGSIKHLNFSLCLSIASCNEIHFSNFTVIAIFLEFISLTLQAELSKI